MWGKRFNYKEVYFQNQCFPFFALLSFFGRSAGSVIH